MISKFIFRVTILFVILASVACTSTGGPRPVDYERAAEINAELGNGYLAQGNLELAKIKFEKALKQNPHLAAAHAGYGLLLGRLGQTESAEKHFKQALRKEPNNPEILNNYGTHLCFQGKIAEAEKLFLKALADPLYRTPEYAYTNAGRCSIMEEDYAKAEAYFGKALQTNPHFAEAIWQMAIVGEHQKKYRMAYSYLRKFEVEGTHNPESLWFGIQLATKMGDKNAVASYSMLLKNQFPKSKQASWLKSN